MPGQVHAVVQDTRNLDHAAVSNAEEQKMTRSFDAHRFSHHVLTAVGQVVRACRPGDLIADVNTGPIRIRGDVRDGTHEQRFVSPCGLGSKLFE
jgi:hypothetical protein